MIILIIFFSGHVGSVAAKYSKNKLNGKRLGILLALDPAGPVFDSMHVDYRLSKDDADYVEAHYTSIEMLGLGNSVADVNIYLDIGQNDYFKVDFFGVAAHSEAVKNFLASIDKVMIAYEFTCPLQFQHTSLCSKEYREVGEENVVLGGAFPVLSKKKSEMKSGNFIYTQKKQN